MIVQTFDPSAANVVFVTAGDSTRTVDLATGEVVTDKTHDKPAPGQLPEAVLDTFRQWCVCGANHG